jgi:predicted acylesterase/phospholipase RssA
MMKAKYFLALLAVVASVSGCAVVDYGAYFNKRAKSTQAQADCQTSFVVRQQREAKNCVDGTVSDPKLNKDVLVLLALSGGGSRAAYFSALSMLEMENLELIIGGSKSNLLHEVDVISSVSGGSLAGAYYAISHDPESECAGHAHRLWTDTKVRELMTIDYRSRWIGRWFYPNNIARFWFTKFDRTDIMAQTLADKLFDKPITGFDLSLGELNPLRPNLILNTTTGIDDGLSGIGFGEVFTFTKEDFARICSSIEDYSVARAVMATAAFPGVFNYMTLRNYCRNDGARDTGDRRYLHVFDGGNADNLGLTSLKRVIWTSLKDRDTQPSLPYKNVIVIVVDAFTNYHGVDPNKPDPRGYFDFILDMNFLDATDSLLEANRKQLLTEFDQEYPNLFPFATGSDGKINKKCRDFFHNDDDTEKYCRKPPSYWQMVNIATGKTLVFVHLSFDKAGDVEGCLPDHVPDPECLRHQLNRIPTDFRLRYLYRHGGTGLTDTEAIDCAVPTLFGRLNQSCGKLSPKPSRDLTRQWERVKQILQEPVAKPLPPVPR